MPKIKWHNLKNLTFYLYRFNGNYNFPFYCGDFLIENEQFVETKQLFESAYLGGIFYSKFELIVLFESVRTTVTHAHRLDNIKNITKT